MAGQHIGMWLEGAGRADHMQLLRPHHDGGRLARFQGGHRLAKHLPAFGMVTDTSPGVTPATMPARKFDSPRKEATKTDPGES